MDQFYGDNLKQREKSLVEISKTVGKMMNASKTDQ